MENLGGVGNEGGCAPRTLAIEVLDGRYNPVDGRFTFITGTAPTSYAQIRADGSIRSLRPTLRV